VPEATILEELGAASGPAERDVLEGLPNEEALQARQVVAALKLSKQELAEHILPEVCGVKEELRRWCDVYRLKHQHQIVVPDFCQDQLA
jgi:hypothetical protein